jgi:pectate lyase
MATNAIAKLAPVVTSLAVAGALSCGSGPANAELHLDAAAAPAPVVEEGLPVFPGAEGFGTRTRAGRGGKIVAVTSLADRGPGTLREALDDPSPKTIVFRVGGVIELKSLLFVAHPFVTIAGQTAPGDGVVLKDFGIVVSTNDVLIQSIRVRPGNKGAIRPDHNDAIAVLGPTGGAKGSYNVVLDHISASWGEDETFSTWFGPHDITVSWSIVSEALNRSRHPKRTHSAGLLVGDHSEHVSLHHNLLAHNDFRNPLIISGGTHDFVNNVVYDWGSLVTEIVDDAPMFVNVVGNWYRPGPSSKTPFEILINPSGKKQVPRIFVEGNVKWGEGAAPASDWSRVHYGWSMGGSTTPYRSPVRFATAAITTTDANGAMQMVLERAGAVAPRRDATDARIVADVRNGTGAIIDTPEQVGGYPGYAGGMAPVDSDGDGMPDEWERRVGLDPANPSDGNADRNQDGYTNLEDYLFSLMPAPRGRSGRE